MNILWDLFAYRFFQHFSSPLRLLVRYCSCHSNIKFTSSRHRVISSMYSPYPNSTEHLVIQSQRANVVRYQESRQDFWLVYWVIFFVKKNTSYSARRVCYGRVVQWVDQWSSEKCMYVTPIRLDLLLSNNQISCCKGKFMWEDLIPKQLRTAIFIRL